MKRNAYINCNFSNKNKRCEFKHGHWKKAQGRQLSLSSNMLVYRQKLHSTIQTLYFTVFQTSLYLNKNMKLMQHILDLKDTLNIK